MTNLILLNLNEANDIGDHGAMLLANAAQKHRGLFDLNLSGNKITHLGVGALVKFLKTNVRLRKLNLSSNLIGDAAVDGLLNLLHTHSAITVSLEGTHLSAEAISKLRQFEPRVSFGVLPDNIGDKFNKMMANANMPAMSALLNALPPEEVQKALFAPMSESNIFYQFAALCQKK
eukprot:TRINITY_DN11851_c0_g1_i1.p2 TRINITY_DN11851_c0_g1~~TRINITY_DN11851_c0_g1_i1.p2  ORF type:complete len:175 (+),score=4.31 TRINITY_DN11851_c0_g1_i1:1340-1864(+)